MEAENPTGIVPEQLVFNVSGETAADVLADMAARLEEAGVVVALGLARPPVPFRAPDGRPVDLVFLLLSPAEAPAAHLAALSRLSRILRAPGAASRLREAVGAEDAARALREAEAGLMVSSG